MIFYLMKGIVNKIDGSSYISLWWMCLLDEIKLKLVILSGFIIIGVCKYDNVFYNDKI